VLHSSRLYGQYSLLVCSPWSVPFPAPGQPDPCVHFCDFGASDGLDVDVVVGNEIDPEDGQ